MKTDFAFRNATCVILLCMDGFVEVECWAEKIGQAEFVECHVCDSLGVVANYAIGVADKVVGFKRTFRCDGCSHTCDMPAFVVLIDRPIEPAYHG